MNRNEFISELRKRLRRLPQDEIESAVSYYEEYFNDAGSQNDSQTIAALGSPSAVASKIIGEYVVNDAEKAKPKRNNVLLITILALCASPIALPIVISIIALVFSIIMVFISIGFSGVAVALAGLFAIVIGFWSFSQGIATGLFYLGVGILTFVIGVVITGLSIKLGQVVFRALQKWIGKLLIKRGAK
ncbi:MAG: DUF1700 domain-containing protein [Dehalococcoidia bacterium]|nr:DUF1700 domain-containing protein [Dehalococcoidia bacterium]